jgi:hypothetical protein
MPTGLGHISYFQPVSDNNEGGPSQQLGGPQPILNGQENFSALVRNNKMPYNASQHPQS